MRESKTYELVRIEDLKPCASNPRKDLGDLSELAENIRLVGILQPLLARPAGKNGHLELVFGHRRLAAAKKAGLETVPVMVRELSDLQVIEAQIIENCHRADIHPLDEADSYRRLHEEFKQSIDELADKVGKSKAYCYARMKLCALGARARKAFLAGKFSASIALLLARIPNPGLQDEAAEIMRRGFDDAPLTYREAFQIIRDHYMLELKSAPFDVKDETLVAEAGACLSCPKRTGNDRLLFEDIRSADVCTDPTCHRQKCQATFDRAAAAAKAGDGSTQVLPPTKAKRVFHAYDSSAVRWDSPYLDLEAPHPDLRYGGGKGTKAKVATLLRAAPPEERPPVLLAQDASGSLRRLVVAKAANAVLKKTGALKKAFSARTSTKDPQQKQREEKARAENKVRAVLREALIARAEATELTTDVLRLLVDGLVESQWHESLKLVCERRGWTPEKKRGGGGRDLNAAIRSKLAGLPPKELRGLCAELIITRRVGNFGTWSSERPETLKWLNELGSALGVDVRRVKAAARKEVAAASKAKSVKKRRKTPARSKRKAKPRATVARRGQRKRG